MAVTLEQIDQRLADWTQNIDRASQNLIDLYGLSAYQRLTGDAGIPKVELRGRTKEQVASALVAMNDLFQHFDLIIQTINQAIALRQQIPRFLGSEQKIQELEQLLIGASIQLPLVQIPLAQRSLLTASASATAIAPDQLLAAMNNAFQVARDVVLAVDEAWMRLELKLATATLEIQSLNQLANSLQASNPLELAAAQQAIAALSDQIEHDPLGVTTDFEQRILPLIAQARSTLEQLAQQQQQVQDGLATAHQLLQQLAALNQQAIAAFAESQAKVVDHSALQVPLAPEHLDAMHQWLTRLETKSSEGLLHPVSIGLTNWTTKMKAYLAAEEKAIATNRQPVQARQELRGRLEALKAKALARGLIEDNTLSDLAEQAKQLLYTRPTPLDKAAELVRQYEQRLNQRKF